MLAEGCGGRGVITEGELSMYYNKLLLGGRVMDVVEDRQNVASLLSGHQDPPKLRRYAFALQLWEFVSFVFFILHLYKATFYLTFCIYTSLLSTPNYNDFRQENVQKLLDFFTAQIES